MTIKVIKYIVEGSMLVISAMPVFAPKRFHYLEKRIPKLCLFIAIAVLGLSATDDIISSKQTQEFERRIVAAEEAAKPIPLSVRLCTLLEEIDPKIIPALRSGSTQFEGEMTASQFTRLQTIGHESEAKELIFIDPTSVRMGVGMGPEGVTYHVVFKIDPKILQIP